MELHRLDGLDAAGIDHMEVNIGETFGQLGFSEQPEIAYEILDENGNVTMYADVDENIYVIDGLNGFFKKIGKGLKKFAKNVIKPVVKTFNRFLNPATILLRNGFLLAMKADMMKVAQRLRYGYLTEAQAKNMDIDMGKYHKLRKAVSKAEKIYEMAGGKKKNLKKAILKGKGNTDRKVPLSGFSFGALEDHEPDIYSDPFEKFIVESDLETFEAFMNNQIQVDGLGAVATGTAMAAASGAVAGVAAVLNKIGNIFGKAKEVKKQATELFQRPAQATSAVSQNFPAPVIRHNISTARKPQTPAIPAKKEESWLQQNKKTVIVGSVILVVAGIGIAVAMRSNKKKKTVPVSGLPKKRKRRERDVLGRFTKGAQPKKLTVKNNAQQKLVPKALL